MLAGASLFACRHVAEAMKIAARHAPRHVISYLEDRCHGDASIAREHCSHLLSATAAAIFCAALMALPLFASVTLCASRRGQRLRHVGFGRRWKVYCFEAAYARRAGYAPMSPSFCASLL